MVDILFDQLLREIEATLSKVNEDAAEAFSRFERVRIALRRRFEGQSDLYSFSRAQSR